MSVHIVIYVCMYLHIHSFPISVFLLFVLFSTYDLLVFAFSVLCSLFAGCRQVEYVPGSNGPQPMAIFELLDYIVNEVCCAFLFLILISD